MKKYLSIIAVCSVLALAACNSAEHKEEGVKTDSTKVENTTPAPENTSNADTTQHTDGEAH
jgi:protein involved in sex pheromone biosynthesis